MAAASLRVAALKRVARPQAASRRALRSVVFDFEAALGAARAPPPTRVRRRHAAPQPVPLPPAAAAESPAADGDSPGEAAAPLDSAAPVTPRDLDAELRRLKRATS